MLFELPVPYSSANSKSANFARPLYMIIFPGLISRCTYPFFVKKARAKNKIEFRKISMK